MQNQDQNSLYKNLYNIVPKNVLATKNRARTWLYGYNEKYDFVVISKTGQIDQIININGLNIALPKPPARVHMRDKTKEEQYWEPHVLPKELKKYNLYFNGMTPLHNLKTNG